VHGFGIVGAGIIASTQARAIAQLADAALVAVTDTGADAARRFAGQHGCEAAPDLDTMLGRDDIDVVSVCVPSGLHAEIGLRAARAGKHLVIEKPLDVTLAAADQLIDAARTAGVRLTVISQHRFDPGLVELKNLISTGALGRLLLGEASTKWYRGQAYYDSAAWRGTWTLDGGSLMNQGIHYVDLLLWAMGPVAEVTALTATQTHQMEAEDIALALLKFRSGALGTLVSSTSVFPGFAQRLEVTGTGGTIVVTDGEITHRGLNAERAAGAGPGAEADPAPVAPVAPGAPAAPVAPAAPGASTPAIGAASHVAQLADLLDAIDEGREPAVTGADGRAAVEVVLAVYESARTTRTVFLRHR
jgi:UDP-N-acetyl-2-amino-2-deoxyglucuronate dehydrogenase